jgi:GNAT superfamily N-acetyltransferase
MTGTTGAVWRPGLNAARSCWPWTTVWWWARWLWTTTSIPSSGRRPTTPERALYVHRMVVTRSAAGGDIGGVMLDWAADLAAGRGLAWLRLDAWRTNLRLVGHQRGPCSVV